MRFNQYDTRSYNRGFSFGPGKISPFIKIMIITNLVVFILQNISVQLTYQLGLTPSRFFNEFPNLFYQPFTYMFLHGGIWHIFFNMFALWMFGTEIEYNWGTKSFGRFYILAGLSGAVLTLLLSPSQPHPMIGASAAIYGVLAAYWVMYPNRYLYFYFLVPIKVKWAIPGFMLIGLLFGGSNIAHLAHLGGAIFGFLYCKSDWRFGSIRNRLKNLRYKRKETKLDKNRQQAEDTMKKVDAILDKINEVGYENLSKKEREFLKDAASELSEKKMNEK